MSQNQTTKQLAEDMFCQQQVDSIDLVYGFDFDNYDHHWVTKDCKACHGGNFSSLCRKGIGLQLLSRLCR